MSHHDLPLEPRRPEGEPRDVAGEVTRLLDRARAGEDSAIARLLPLVYEELRALAGSAFRGQGADHTLQPTALVHDAYLKLLGSECNWNDRRHFFVVASKAMRQILTDYARARRASKRGGQWREVSLSEAIPGVDSDRLDLLRLDEALSKLQALAPRQARIVELRFLGALPVEEVAQVLGCSVATVGNEWRTARAFLRSELS